MHSHHYPDSYLDACRRPDSGFTHYYRDDGRLVVLQDGGVALAVPQPLPPLEHRIDLMDQAGVDVQVLSVSAPNVFRFSEDVRIPLTRDLNDEYSDLAAGSDGRLRIFISLPLPAIDAALEEFDRALALPYVVGVVVCSNIDRINLDDERFSPIWEELSRRRATVFCHPTVACCTDGLREYAMSLAMGFMADTMFAVGRLAYAGTFDRFPGIRWIFTHLGGTIPFVLPRYDNYYKQFPECRENLERPALGGHRRAVLRHGDHARSRASVRARHVRTGAARVRLRLPARAWRHRSVRDGSQLRRAVGRSTGADRSR